MVTKRIIPLILASTLSLALVGCQQGLQDHARSRTGQDLGKKVWKEISDRESVVYIEHSPEVRTIEANDNLYDRRHQERIRLNSGFIFYEKLASGSFVTDLGLRESLYLTIARNKTLSEKRGLSVTRDEIKEISINGIDYAYVAKDGDHGTCFVFKAFFGHAYGISLGDTSVQGGVCHDPGRLSVATVESTWISILERLRFDGPKPGWSGRAKLVRNRNEFGEAVIAGDVEKVREMLAADSDPNAMTSFIKPNWNRGKEWHTSVLVAAIVYRHPAIVDLILERKPSFDKFHNQFAICPAVNSGQASIVQSLVTAGINVNPEFSCIRGLSPLESAKSRNFDNITEILENAGAS